MARILHLFLFFYECFLTLFMNVLSSVRNILKRRRGRSNSDILNWYSYSPGLKANTKRKEKKRKQTKTKQKPNQTK